MSDLKVKEEENHDNIMDIRDNIKDHGQKISQIEGKLQSSIDTKFYTPKNVIDAKNNDQVKMMRHLEEKCSHQLTPNLTPLEMSLIQRTMITLT